MPNAKELQNRTTDYTVTTLKGALGAVPLRLAATQELGRVGRKATFLKPIPINSDGN
jgi:hypothetical protein